MTNKDVYKNDIIVRHESWGDGYMRYRSSDGTIRYIGIKLNGHTVEEAMILQNGLGRMLKFIEKSLTTANTAVTDS